MDRILMRSRQSRHRQLEFNRRHLVLRIKSIPVSDAVSVQYTCSTIIRQGSRWRGPVSRKNSHVSSRWLQDNALLIPDYSLSLLKKTHSSRDGRDDVKKTVSWRESPELAKRSIWWKYSSVVRIWKMMKFVQTRTRDQCTDKYKRTSRTPSRDTVYRISTWIDHGV